MQTVWECWKVTHKFCCKFTSFGIKCTGRKRKGASKPPREWLEIMLKIVNGETCLLISQKQWESVNTLILKIKDELKVIRCLNHIREEQYR